MSDPAFLFAKFFHLCRATTYDGEIKVYIFSGPAFSALPFPGLRGGGIATFPLAAAVCGRRRDGDDDGVCDPGTTQPRDDENE